MKKYTLLALLMLPLAAHAAMTGAPLDVDSDRLEVDQNKGHAVFIGNVKAVRGGMTLTSAQADVMFTTSKNSEIQTVTATGNVVITRDNGDTAHGDKGVYTPADGKLVLTGTTVVLTRGGHTVQGTRLDYDTVADQAVMTGGSPTASTTGAANTGGRVHAHFQSEPK